RVLFENLSLKLNSGSFYLIRGPSGSGKSTFLRLINRAIALERLLGELRRRRLEVEARLCLGAGYKEASQDMFRNAMRAGMTMPDWVKEFLASDRVKYIK
ncbi:MAG: ATP-binding cassette domain-containing protein, partial [Simkaniaceae bacterium]|nr:ATP-binding cassette domain-containing protein [Simkaniaceae bacterium]